MEKQQVITSLTILLNRGIDSRQTYLDPITPPRSLQTLIRWMKHNLTLNFGGMHMSAITLKN
ncbi:hypothetical protein [Paenibacillus dendritiformis]|uniref:hypothetical protein n=1 Tax=Paenibacillus dendritiformis TaxID=130049 RepID=UPI000DA7387A|nr:hypothetical protein [Paenibacillus dendritiformis]PZM61985.1 hypothetical protein DOE73_29760 [Paenibacillus dendritiformis]